MKREAPFGSPVVTVDVADIDGALESIEKLGGTTVIAKQTVGDMGFTAYFKDPEGEPDRARQTARAPTACGSA